MTGKAPVRVGDLRGYSRLAVDAIIGLTRLVETMHHNVLRTPGILGKATQKPTRGMTGFVYKSIRGVVQLSGGGIDAILARLVPWFTSSASTREREAVLAVLNGVLGDHLHSSGNPLAIHMGLRRDGKLLPLQRDALAAVIPGATGKILLLVHGLCMNDLEWQRNGYDHGANLAADAGFTAVYLHYNSGLHISTNGRNFAEQLAALMQAWPVAVDELVILAHSMGGLVTRSACHYAQVAQHAWRKKLSKIIFLGTPHFGAPLERGGAWIDALLEASPYSTAFARLGKIRSAGIVDLRYASLLDVDWQRHERGARSSRKPTAVPLPSGVKCYAIAASITKKPGKLNARWVGDGLVPLPSALGRHKLAGHDLNIAKSRQWIGYGMNHLDLLDRRDVYLCIRRWLQNRRDKQLKAPSILRNSDMSSATVA